MQCNPYCGTGQFSNGPVFNYNNTPPSPFNPGVCPEVVGEGEVTSVTLPDGTVQFFFMPTVKWWAQNPCNQPNFNNYANISNVQPNTQSPWNNNNVGTWFVRNITNPFSHHTAFPPRPTQRYDLPRPCYSSDFNMNNFNGYQLKFHSDVWTSTTDLAYFFPALRQQRWVTEHKHTSKRNVHVQVEIESPEKIVCQNVIECKCNEVPESMSLVSLVDPKPNNFSGSDYSSDDTKKKKRKNKRKCNARNKKSKSKHGGCVCACESTDKIITANKSVSTFEDRGISCGAADGRPTQTIPLNNNRSCCSHSIPMRRADQVLQRCQVKRAETWHPVTPYSKRSFSKRSSEPNSSEHFPDDMYTSDNEYNGGCSSGCSCCSGD